MPTRCAGSATRSRNRPSHTWRTANEYGGRNGTASAPDPTSSHPGRRGVAGSQRLGERWLDDERPDARPLAPEAGSAMNKFHQALEQAQRDRQESRQASAANVTPIKTTSPPPFHNRLT